MRHAPFHIGVEEKDAWMEHMSKALDSMGPAIEIKEAMLEYFEMASTHMINAEM